jgi:hypothetical protein
MLQARMPPSQIAIALSLVRRRSGDVVGDDPPIRGEAFNSSIAVHAEVTSSLIDSGITYARDRTRFNSHRKLAIARVINEGECET